MAKWLIPAFTCAVGVCLFAGGLLYGVATVGVPTPDASPAVAAQESRDAGMAGVAMATGLVAVASGVVGFAVVDTAHVAWRRASEADSGAAPDPARDSGSGSS